MTSTIKKVSSNTQLAFKGMSDAQGRFQNNTQTSIKNINNLNSAIEHLKSKRMTLDITNSADIARLRVMNTEIKNLERNVNKFQTMNGSKLKSLASDAINQVPGIGLISNPLVLAGAAASYSAKKGMELQANQVKFGTLMGSDKMGNYMYNQLKSYSDVTPYRKDDILNSGETLLNFGLSANKVMPTMKMLGDISAGNAERLKDLSLAFGEVSASGKLTGKHLLQMINGGFNPLQVMSEQTGISMAKLDEKMRKGEITVAMVEGAMKSATGEGGRFHNMVIKLGGTLHGQITTFLDKLDNTAASLGQVMLPILTSALGLLNKAFSFIGENGKAIAIVLGGLGLAFFYANAGAIAAGIGFTWMSVTTNLLSSSFLKLTLAMLTNPMTWIILGVIALVAAIKYAWDHFEGFRKVVMGVWEVMKNFGTIIKDFIINRITELLDGIMGVGKALAKLFTGDFSGAWDTAKQSAKQILGITSAEKAGKQIAGLYNTGADKGAASWKADQDAKYQASLMKQGDPLADTIIKAFDLAHSKTLQKQTFGSDTKALHSFLDVAKQITYDSKAHKYSTNQTSGNAMDYIMSLQDAMKGKGKGAASGGDGSEDDDTAKGIAKGGPRVINITINKLVEKIDIHSSSVKEGLNDAAEMIKEPFLRMLYSGAKMQS